MLSVLLDKNTLDAVTAKAKTEEKSLSQTARELIRKGLGLGLGAE